MKMEEKYVIGLDVGGTSLKAAIVSSKGRILKNTFKKTPINSSGSAEAIISTFENILSHTIAESKERCVRVLGIAISTCGPFDLEKGIPLMKHKYASIYGLNLKHELIRRLHLNIPILFDRDSWSFLRGEEWVGAAKGYKRIVGITIGSGLGSAFMVNGEIVVEGPGIPPSGSLWNLPYKGGILEEVAPVCKRSIIRRYRELGGSWREGMDVKDIASKAFRGEDEASAKVFNELGGTLGEVLKPYLLEFNPDCVIFGGQISKSFMLFSKPLKDTLKEVKSINRVVPAKYIDKSNIFGATKFFLSKYII
jgi:glucokinase